VKYCLEVSNGNFLRLTNNVAKSARFKVASGAYCVADLPFTMPASANLLMYLYYWCVFGTSEKLAAFTGENPTKDEATSIITSSPTAIFFTPHTSYVRKL